MKTKDILRRAEEISKEIINWRRDLHQIPEVGSNTPKTSDYIKKALTDMGISYTSYETHSGLSVLLGKPGEKCIAVRADMDGLPIQEQTGCSFQSTNGNMHACGHDAHTAILLGTAKILKEHEDELPGYVKLIFQAGEETGDGAEHMIADGVLEAPEVDALISLHVEIPEEGMERGDIIVPEGYLYGSNDEFYLTIKGKGGHGGQPYQTVDPVSAAAQLINSLQHLISRESNYLAPAVLSIGEVYTEKGAVNIVPEKISINGTIRSSNANERQKMLQRFEEIVKGICAATRTEYELRYFHGEPAVANDEKMKNLLISGAEALYGPEHVRSFQMRSLCSEDIGYFFERVPGVMWRFCVIAPDAEGIVQSLHNAKMTIDDSLLYRGTALMVEGVRRYLENEI